MIMARWVLVLLGLAACSPPAATHNTRGTEGTSMTEASDGAASIGVATMQPDGTILLQLRAEGPGGLEGDALLTYPPADPDYANVLQHLGGLAPGQSKPVPPWPDAGVR
jgi:hypothetical protein